MRLDRYEPDGLMSLLGQDQRASLPQSMPEIGKR